MGDQPREGFQFCLWTCKGYHIDRTGKALTVEFKDNTQDDTFYLTVKQAKGCVPGGVYKVEANGSTFYAPFSSSYIGMHPDKDEVAAWQTRSRAEELALKQDKTDKKEQSRKYILDALEPLREEYAKASYDGKRMIELMLLDFLRR